MVFPSSDISNIIQDMLSRVEANIPLKVLFVHFLKVMGSITLTDKYTVYFISFFIK